MFINNYLPYRKKLERHYKNMQDIEFTIECGRLFILQSRNGKRTAQAAIKIAVSMVKEKLISRADAIKQVNPDQLNQLLHPTIPAAYKANVLCKGFTASPGAAVGKVVFTPEDARVNGSKMEKKLFWYARRHLLKIFKECMPRKLF